MASVFVSAEQEEQSKRHSLLDIKLAAYNWEELPDMTPAERNLWMGLGYAYEWYRSHPEEKSECDELAKEYIAIFERGMMG